MKDLPNLGFQFFRPYSNDSKSILLLLAGLSSQASALSLTKWIGSLSLEDQRVLRDNEWLSANHISEANKLMLKAFPRQNGLQDTHYLAMKMSWPSVSKDFVQIIHVGNSHWACLSNKLCKEDNVVELYDSMLTKPGKTVQKQVSTIMNSEAAAITLRIMNVKRQQSGHACGLYAIAMAVDLCLGKDPCSSLYDEAKMRSHLELCFSHGTISQFPHQYRDKRQRILDEISISVYCVCRYPDVMTRFGNMICCDLCNEWYHEHCLSIPDIEVLKQSEWLCPRCLVEQ